MAKATLPKEKISSFTTHFPAGQPRVHNIKLASRIINGTYIPPGEQFSMNGILGERTAAKGYIEAGIIRDGRAAKSYGGGISQVSTTIFNAAFFSGMQLDAWTPHYYYISRYPEGREATISWPDLHNKFTNTTDGGVLIQIRTPTPRSRSPSGAPRSTTSRPPRAPGYDIVQPKKFSDDGPDCLDQSPGPRLQGRRRPDHQAGRQGREDREVHDQLPPRGRRHVHQPQAVAPDRRAGLSAAALRLT